MSKGNFFVGRQQELTLVDELVSEFGKRHVLIVDGPGGIGKTSLLREIRSRYGGKGSPLIVTSIIDLDETSLRMPENLTRELAQQVGEAAFESYFLRLDELARMEVIGSSNRLIEDKRDEVREAFLSCYLEQASSNRMIILVDTVERIRGTETWNYLASLGASLENTLLVLAGRKSKAEERKLLEEKSDYNTRNVTHLLLDDFEAKEVRAYLRAEDLLIETELQRKLQLLTQGHPILIALACEWLRREMSLPELAYRSIEEIEALKPKELLRLQKDFEEELVSSVLDLGEPLDRAVLLMAYVDRHFDERILRFLSGLSAKKCATIISGLEGLTFVKSRPRGVALHDEMRRLVRSYVWPSVDPMGTERRDLLRRATSHYDKLVQRQEGEITKLDDRYREATATGEVEKGVRALAELDSKRRELQILHIDRLHYARQAGPSEGLRCFKESFDIQRKRFGRDYYRALLEEVERFKGELDTKKRLKVALDRVRFLRWEEGLEEAHQILMELEDEQTDDAESEVDLQSAWAGYHMDRGNLPQALRYAERGLDICRQSVPEWQARLENLVGMLNRRMGRWSAATEHYRSLIKHTTPEDIKGLLNVASAFNNLAFVLGLLGESQSGLTTCREGLEIRKEYGTERDIAISLITLGSLHWAKGDYLIAREWYEKAAKKLRWPEDWDLVARVSFSNGIAYWFAEKFERAKQSFEKCISISKDHGFVSELPLATHDLGHVYWDLGDTEKAENLFNESYILSKEHHDYHALVDTLAGFAELYYELGRYDQIAQYTEELKELEEQGYQFPLFAGRVERIKGDIAFDRGKYDEAIDLYCDGLVEIAHHGGYGRYSLRQELARLGDRMDLLAPETIVDWCDKLSTRWQYEKLERERPEMPSFCLARRSTAMRSQISI